MFITTIITITRFRDSKIMIRIEFVPIIMVMIIITVLNLVIVKIVIK